MSAADVVLTITTETKGRIRLRRVTTVVLAALASTAASLVLPGVLSGNGTSTREAVAAVHFSRAAGDLNLSCRQFRALAAEERRDAAIFFAILGELAAGIRQAGDFLRPAEAVIRREAAKIVSACHDAEADFAKDPRAREPLVIRALRDYS